MFRGFTKFQCDNCGKKFRALDCEYAATIYSAPQRCPECGSMHTAPPGLLNKAIYRQIWERYDQANCQP